MKVLATATSDEDGFASIAYAHKGKPATYYVTISEFGKYQEITLKSKELAEVEFDDLPE